MKNIFIFLTVLSFSCSSEIFSVEGNGNLKTLDTIEKTLTDFLNKLESKDTIFREHYEGSRNAVLKILDTLESGEKEDLNFKMDAILINKKAVRKLNDFNNVILGFQDSSNFNIQKIAKEGLKIIEFGNVVLQQDYKFIIAPQKFLSSEDEIIKLAEYTALLKEQYEHIGELIEGILETEKNGTRSVNSHVEFQYTEKELNDMGKWKDKTMDDLLQDAYQGDAVALYMMGLGYLYGKSGFPINVEYADHHFVVSALLGFAPAIDKIRGMYLESDNSNPFLVYVYVNLTAAFGHPEYTMAYHEMRQKIGEKFGFAIVKEIERIAAEKTVKIYQAMNEIG